MKIDESTNLIDGNICIENGQIKHPYKSNETISYNDALKLCYYFAVAMRK